MRRLGRANPRRMAGHRDGIVLADRSPLRSATLAAIHGGKFAVGRWIAICEALRGVARIDAPRRGIRRHRLEFRVLHLLVPVVAAVAAHRKTDVVSPRIHW